MGIVVRQSFLNLISIGVAFLIGAVNTLYLYPTFLGSKFQGLVIALLAISNLVQPFISFGTQHAVIRFYSKYNKKEDRDGLLTLSILIPTIIVVLFVPIFFTFYDEIRQYLFQNDQSLSKYAYVILFIAISTSFFEVFYSWLRVKLKSVFGNFLKELYPRLLIAILLVSYSFGILNFESFILFLIYGYYLRLLIVITYSFYANKPKLNLVFKTDFKEIFKYCLLIFLSGAATSIILDIDKSMLSSILSVENVAYYSVAVFIAAVVEIPGRAMFQILNPMVAKALNKKNFKELDSLYRKSSKNLLIICGFFFLLINLNIDSFYQLMNNELYSGATFVVFIISSAKLIQMSFGCGPAILATSSFYKITLPFSLTNLIDSVNPDVEEQAITVTSNLKIIELSVILILSNFLKTSIRTFLLRLHFSIIVILVFGFKLCV